MIHNLARILGPRHTGQLRAYLGWLVAYSVLEGIAMAFLVPILGAMFTGNIGLATHWLALLTPVVILACTARYRQSMLGFSLALLVLTTLHNRLGEHISQLPLGWFSSERVGRLSRSSTTGTLMVTNVFAHLLAPVVSGIVTPATIAIAILFFDWRLGLSVMVAAPLIYLAHRWSSTWIGRMEESVDAAGAQASNRVIEFARNQQALRAFGRTTEDHPPLEAALEAQRKAGGSMLRETFPRLLFGGASVQLAFVVLIIVGVQLAIHQSVDAIELVALLALTARFTSPLAESAARSGQLKMAANDLRRLVSILNEKPMPEPARSLPMPTPGMVEMSGVTFGYRADTPVLRELSFKVPARTMTAIVGPSGSGKSTITRLLMRFFDVDSGAVMIGGVDVRNLSTEDLMAQVSPVMQDVYLFNESLEANIRLGRPDATRADVLEAARIAGVSDIVERLPQGWQTPVGEGGALLSGGERQRVSLARALLKDAPIVLLDEATAALDPENEQNIQQALATLKNRSSLLVIAHRLSTTITADQILVLDDGHIAESGTHEELLSLNGRYTNFWNERRRAEGWRLAKETAA